MPNMNGTPDLQNPAPDSFPGNTTRCTTVQLGKGGSRGQTGNAPLLKNAMDFGFPSTEGKKLVLITSICVIILLRN